MSWFFGSGKSNAQLPPGVPSPPSDPNKDENKKSTQVKAGGYSFDSEALERAAKAAKELEASSLNFNIFIVRNYIFVSNYRICRRGF